MRVPLMIVRASPFLSPRAMGLTPLANFSRAESFGFGSIARAQKTNASSQTSGARQSKLFASNTPNTPQGRVLEMSVEELDSILSTDSEASDSQLLDVREPYEVSICSLPKFRSLPMSKVREWGRDITEELDVDMRTIVLCHHGIRSQAIAEFLVSQGFISVYNVAGGIDAYAKERDSSMERY